MALLVCLPFLHALAAPRMRRSTLPPAQPAAEGEASETALAIERINMARIPRAPRLVRAMPLREEVAGEAMGGLANLIQLTMGVRLGALPRRHWIPLLDPMSSGHGSCMRSV